jgi:transposase
VPKSIPMMIRQSAENILLLNGHKEEMKRILEDLAKSRNSILELMYDESNGKGLKGIGVITAATMIAEIIHINRFVKEDSLALYAGFGMVEDETGKKKPGDRKKMKHSHEFNRRLKNAFMNAAKNFVHWNPDHHLAGMHRNLIKRGMSRLEANKRVSRALVRKIFKILKVYVELESTKKMEENGAAKVG